jgi:hypothetical protein
LTQHFVAVALLNNALDPAIEAVPVFFGESRMKSKAPRNPAVMNEARVSALASFGHGAAFGLPPLW